MFEKWIINEKMNKLRQYERNSDLKIFPPNWLLFHRYIPTTMVKVDLLAEEEATNNGKLSEMIELKMGTICNNNWDDFNSVVRVSR